MLASLETRSVLKLVVKQKTKGNRANVMQNRREIVTEQLEYINGLLRVLKRLYSLRQRPMPIKPKIKLFLCLFLDSVHDSLT